MTPSDRIAALTSEVVAFLTTHHDADFAAGQQRFFQNQIAAYGTRGDKVREIARRVYAEVQSWPVGQRDTLMERLWDTGRLEPGAIVCHVYRRFANSCGPREFKLFARWIETRVDNWAHCDGVASWLLAASIANAPELRHRLTAWTVSSNRWQRRASAVALLQEAKSGRHPEFIFEVAGRLLDDRDDMVEKGVGWLLKETYPSRPTETVAFLQREGGRASRLTLRYAAEKMTRHDRALVLGTGGRKSEAARAGVIGSRRRIPGT